MTADSDSTGEAMTAPPAAVPAANNGWRVAGAVTVVAVAAIVAIYWPTFLSMVEIWWRSDTFAHGFLIIPISLYMIWTRWDTIRHVPPAPNYWVVPILLAASAGWFLAFTADVVVLTQLGLIVLLQLAVVSILGWRTAWAMAFPLAYLWFAVPVGEELQEPMIDFTADFTVAALNLTGVPVFREARYLTLPTGNWEVAEACSGIRYLIASLALGCLYAYLTYRALWRRLLFIALALVVPVLANGMRAYGIVMIGHLSDMKLATGVDHIVYGWVFFGVVMLLLFMLGSLWREPAEEEARAAERDRIEHQRVSTHATKPGLLLGIGLATVIAAGAGQGLVNAFAAMDSGHGDYALTLPQAQAGWQGPLDSDDPWQPDFVGATDGRRAQYAGPPGQVEVRLAHYRQEGQGAELINALNQVWDRESWRRLGESRHTVSIDGVGDFAVLEAVIGRGGTQRVIWYWYDISGRDTANPMVAKLYGLLAKVTVGHPGGTFIAVAADGEEGAAPARETLQAFLAANTALITEDFVSGAGSAK
ncbi:MAG: exosortase A [Gammaproteobacteria bacterium]|nr:exosortase A [Gammaproteobacteria bacterium]